MEHKVMEIHDYRYHLFSSRSVQQGLPCVSLYDADGALIGAVSLFPEDAMLPTTEAISEVVYLQYPRWVLPQLIDMLRNEKPTFLHWRGDSNTCISTSAEPVGEGAMVQTAGPAMGRGKTAQGRTTPGSTDWQTYPPGSAPEVATGLYVDVDTSDAGFESEPLYFTSIGGWGSHWILTGASAIYGRVDAGGNGLPMKTGFRVYIRDSGGGNLTPDIANQRRWHINWMAIAGE